MPRTKHVPREADIAYNDWYAAHSHKFLINNVSAHQSTVDDHTSVEQWSYDWASRVHAVLQPPQPNEETVQVSRHAYYNMRDLYARWCTHILIHVPEQQDDEREE